jgi:hypothetical protein
LIRINGWPNVGNEVLAFVDGGERKDKEASSQDSNPSGSAFGMELEEFMVRQFFAVTV